MWPGFLGGGGSRGVRGGGGWVRKAIHYVYSYVQQYGQVGMQSVLMSACGLATDLNLLLGVQPLG